MTKPEEVTREGRAVAAVLRERAALLGMNKSEVARRSGVEVSKVNRALRGVRQLKVDELFDIAEALDIGVREVIARAEEHLSAGGAPEIRAKPTTNQRRSTKA